MARMNADKGDCEGRERPGREGRMGVRREEREEHEEKKSAGFTVLVRVAAQK